MVRIDLRNQQRHIRFHAMISGIGNNHVPGLGKRPLDFGGHGGIHCREHQTRRAVARLAVGHGESRGLVRHRAIEPPASGFAVDLSRGAIACADPGQIEPGMVLKELHKMLADHAGPAQHAYWYAFVHNLRG